MRTQNLGTLIAAAIVVVASVGVAAPASATPQPSEPISVAHDVPTSTRTVSANDYLLKWDSDDVSRAVDIDLTVGADLTLTTDDTGALQITDAGGELHDRLDLPALVASDNTSVSTWTVSDDHHAHVTLSQASIDHAATTFGPSQKWFNCMSSHGISGAISGAVAGCATTIAIGCVEGAVTGGLAGMIGMIVAGLWDCRDVF
jgi:hypothetical protein